MIKSYTKKIGIILSMMLLVLAACGGNSGSSSKELTIATDRGSNSLNNVITTESANSDIIGNFMEGLLIRDLDGKMQPGAASEWNVSDDGLTYTFKLRDNNWSNGTPVTANDFVFSWRQQATNKKAGYSQYQAYLKNGPEVIAGEKPATDLGIEAKDDKTVVVTLSSPRSYFSELLDHMSMMPINEAFYNEVGADVYGTSKDTVLANAAYVLTDYAGDQGWTFEKRPEYWDAKSVSIEKITTRVVKEATTRSSMWDNGELDETYITGDLIEKYQGNDNIVKELDWGMYYMYVSPFAGNAPDYANANLRKTIMHGIDRELLTESVLKDGSLPANYVIPEGISVSNYDGLFRDAPGAYSEKLFNLTEAQGYWEAAKKELGKDQITIPLTVDDAETNKKVFSNIKAQLEQNFPGLTVDLQTLPNQTYFPTLYEYNTPAARHGWITTINDPTTIFALFTSDSKNNFGKVQIEKFTSLYEKTEGAEDMLDVDLRVKDLVETEKELIDQSYNIPLYQRGRIKLVATGVKGLTTNSGKQNPFYRWVTKA